MQINQILSQNYQNQRKTGRNIPDKSLGLRVPRKNIVLQRTQAGCLIMSEQNIKKLCQIQGLYQYPEMNNKLYLHYKVIQKIDGLQKYINIKTLYLQNNVINKIQNLQHLQKLQNLFLQNNMIKKIQGINKLKQLKVLNLSNNNLFKLQGLDELLQLQNLTLTKNFLSDFDSLQHLGHCSNTLTALDLSDNQIVADDRLFDLVQQIKCIYLSGNPLVRQILHYRRTIVGRLPQLMYLDQRAVDSQQRFLAQSWIKQGQLGYKKAKQKITELRKQKRQQSRKQIMKNIDIHRKRKINVFEGNILEAQQQINKLRGYIRQPGNQDQIFFYQNRISELMIKIKENQQFINSIYQRMGMQIPPPLYTIDLQIPSQEPQASQQPQGIYQIRQQSQNAEDDNISSNRSEHSSQNISHQSSNNQSSSSQQSSLKTYNSNNLDQLD